jgi:hypothetical protein
MKQQSDNPEQLLATFGWEAEVVQPGDEEAHFGHIPVCPSDCNLGQTQGNILWLYFYAYKKKLDALTRKQLEVIGNYLAITPFQKL